MGRRKSLLAQMYTEHRKAAAARARERDRAAKEYARNQDRIARELAAEQSAADRAAEKQRQAAARKAEQAAKARERERIADAAAAEKARERELRAAAAAAEKAERDRARAAAAAERDRVARARAAEKAAVDEQHALARARTDEVAALVAGFDDVLAGRTAMLRGRAHEVGHSFDTGGAEAFGAVLDAALARSCYPDGVVVGVSTRFFPESREVVVDCELPRQAIVPRAIAYHYRAREKETRAEPRKEGEIRRIYRELIARVSLRVVAEIFYATPAPLVDSVVFNGFVSARDRAAGAAVCGVVGGHA